MSHEFLRGQSKAETTGANLTLALIGRSESPDPRLTSPHRSTEVKQGAAGA